MESRSPSIPWTREHRLLALNLYHKLPFGRLHKTNPAIVEVAQRMGRSANSLAMKLTNFASLDPILQARGIRGLDGASKADQEQWQEFKERLDVLAPESECLLQNLLQAPEDSAIEFNSSTQGMVIHQSTSATAPTVTEAFATIQVRRGQNFFRQAILTSYGGRCGITGLDIPELLVASHIRPWAHFPEERLNPRNGICLSRLHDGAFDQGLITFDADLRMQVSARLKESHSPETVSRFFLEYEGAPLRATEQISEPHREWLSWHRDEIFLS